MHTRKLGSQGLAVSALGLGCMGLSTSYGPAEDDESIATVNRAIDLGITMLDTAEAYGPFKNEELIGRAIRGRHDEVQLATKFGAEFDSSGRRINDVTGRPDYLRKALEGSLRRLGVETVDLYYVHRVDPNVPIEETFGALHDLVEAGMIRFLGISEAAPETIRRAHATHPLTAVQTEYSLFTREVEVNGVLDTTRELGIGFVAYSPLGRGFLSGAIRSSDGLAERDFRRTSPRFASANLAQNLATLDRLLATAEARDVTGSQLALAWVLAQGDDIVPIPGTRRISHLEENAAAARIRLSEEEISAIDAVAPVGVAAGDRYDPSRMTMLYK